MVRRVTVVSFAVLFLLSGIWVSSGYADGSKKSKDHHQGLEEKVFHKAHFFLKNQEELELSDEQVAKIKELKLQSKKDLIKRKAEIDVLAVDIKSKLYDDTIDVNAVNKLIDQKYELKKSKTKFLVKTCADLKNVLTEEQKEKVKSLWKKCDKR